MKRLIIKEVLKTRESTEVEFYLDDEYLGYGEYEGNDRNKKYDWVETIIEKIAEQFDVKVENEYIN